MTAIGTCLGESCSFTAEYLAWMPTIAITIVGVFALISIVYMLGRALERREFEAFAKTESWHAVVALIWAIIISSFAMSMCTLSCTVADTDPFAVAADYLQTLQVRIEGSIVNMLDVAKAIRINSAVMYLIPPSESCMKGLCVRPWEGCATIANNYENMAIVMSPFAGSIIAQQMVIRMIYAFVFSLLLPIGVILRVIPFTRDAGASVIAIAVAMYIVFPLTYVFAYKAVKEIPDFGKAQYVSVPSNCEDKNTVKQALENIAIVLPQAVFFPALSMVITIGAARTLQKVFSYDFQELF